MEERSPCGSGGCITCPFSLNEEAEIVQNYGCLPTGHDIVQLKKRTGHNWSCHGDETKVCGGLASHLKDYHPELSIHEGKLISYDLWYKEGEEEAIRKAK
ncbi:hypothetical protein [Pontibacillus sp. ALD_SL1]|uniref:hypothetical protein n=1 Tax=Pontibacillus sp. ALD_SL1 TaxID=2777185 RepID=UPI001F60068F|nr:hypothetical protein [Pontibacillus sp. ALD_SL1]